MRPPEELVEHSMRETGRAGIRCIPNGMAESNSATKGVHLLRVEAEELDVDQSDDRESLVDLPEVNVVHSET